MSAPSALPPDSLIAAAPIAKARPAIQVRTGRLRWWIISLVTLGTILNYLARSSLSAAAPTLKEVFSLTTQQYSYVVGAFQAAYTLMQPIAGYVLDLLGTRLGFAIFAIGWSLSNMLHAFAAGWQSLAACRGLLGLTEASVIPGGLKVVSEWFPRQERTVATGWFNIGSSLGAMIAPPLVIFCIYVWGWESAFLITGGDRLPLGWTVVLGLSQAGRAPATGRGRTRVHSVGS